MEAFWRSHVFIWLRTIHPAHAQANRTEAAIRIMMTLTPIPIAMGFNMDVKSLRSIGYLQQLIP